MPCHLLIFKPATLPALVIPETEFRTGQLYEKNAILK
jgi:hypothetical protein